MTIDIIEFLYMCEHVNHLECILNCPIAHICENADCYYFIPTYAEGEI